MLEAEARKAAESARAESGVPEGFQLEWARQRYIEMSKADAGGIQLVRDFLVWVARFSKDMAWWELALDDKKGRVIRVERSR
jgi:hypothetical protein